MLARRMARFERLLPPLYGLWSWVLVVSVLQICQGARARHGTINVDNVAASDAYSERCGETSQIPYTPSGLIDPSRLREASVPDRCLGATSLGAHFMTTTTFSTPTEWMQKDIPVPYFVYYAGGSNETHRHENVGFEAMGYLTFIAEYYYCLPDVVLFAHPHKTTYYSVHSLDKTLELVQWDKVPGYATMHPNGASWADFQPRDPVLNLGQPLTGAALQTEIPCNQIFNGTAYDYWPSWNYRRAQYVGKAWDRFFGSTEVGAMPERLRMPLVAEFFARRERIRLRSRKFYLQALNWVSESCNRNELTNWEMAVTWELLWHYVLGEPAYMPGLTVKPCALYRCRHPEVE